MIVDKGAEQGGNFIETDGIYHLGLFGLRVGYSSDKAKRLAGWNTCSQSKRLTEFLGPGPCAAFRGSYVSYVAPHRSSVRERCTVRNEMDQRRFATECPIELDREKELEKLNRHTSCKMDRRHEIWRSITSSRGKGQQDERQRTQLCHMDEGI